MSLEHFSTALKPIYLTWSTSDIFVTMLRNSHEVHLLATGLRHFLASSFSGRCLMKVCKLRLAITTPKDYISLKKDWAQVPSIISQVQYGNVLCNIYLFFLWKFFYLTSLINMLCQNQQALVKKKTRTACCYHNIIVLDLIVN